MEKNSQVHNIPPLYDAHSRVLILGSFPSVKSREAAFFYAHPQNRFWPTLAALFGEEVPKTVEEKRSLALRHGIALWDTIGSRHYGLKPEGIEIVREMNRVGMIVDVSHLGDDSFWDVVKYSTKPFVASHSCCRALAGREAVKLPSTSPANARWTQEKLLKAWREALGPYLSIV